eukprot:TRINITY_DN3169_c0_g1_i3.p1 TRINITY_DN3169_c0_g1~~TRINITY_DN3169_c0_g1_i3.p1  ORF type:complete len:455 (-),score=84.34 TRINITY_DN3169_c0_g1_i3:666-2030(-)
MLTVIRNRLRKGSSTKIQPLMMQTGSSGSIDRDRDLDRDPHKDASPSSSSVRDAIESGHRESHSDDQNEQVEGELEDEQEDDASFLSVMIGIWFLVQQREFWDALHGATVIYPDSYFYRMWSTMFNLQVMYTVWSVPFIIALKLQDDPVWLFAEGIVNVVVILNLFVNFRLAHIENSEYVTDFKEICKHYLRTWFFFDFVAAIPFSFIAEEYAEFHYMRLTSLFQTGRLFEIGQFNIWRSASAFQRLYKSFIRFIILCHLVGCAYLMIGRFEGYPVNVFYIAQLPEKGDLSKYIYGFSWAGKAICSFGTLVKPKTDAEHILVIIVALSGVATMGSFLGSMTSAIESLNQNKNRFVDRLRGIDEYMSLRNLPPQTRERVRLHYSKLWVTNRGLDEGTILEDLPRDLRAEVATYLRKDLLKKLHFFKDAQDEFIRELSLRIQPSLYVAGEYVFRHG